MVLPVIRAAQRYQRFLRTPHVRGVIISSAVGRLPDTLIPYGLLLFLAPRTGFALAGAASGAYSLGQALASPVRGRLIDRVGASIVLSVGGSLQSLILLGLVWAATAEAGASMLIAASAITGMVAPPVGVVVRRVWGFMMRKQDAKNTAYAFESVTAETLFIGGTVIAGSLATLGVTSLILAAACRAIGVLTLARQLPVRTLPTALEDVHWLGPLTSRAFRMLLIVAAFNFAVFGALDVGVAAFARASAAASLTGLLLAMTGLGSIVGGLVQGGRNWTGPLTRQQTGWLAAMSVATASVILAPNLALLALLLLVAGFPVAPAYTVQLTLGSEFAPPGTKTEALTWLISLQYVGFAVGNAFAGRVVQDAGPRAAFAAAAVFACAATVLSLVGRGRLKEVFGRHPYLPPDDL